MKFIWYTLLMSMNFVLLHGASISNVFSDSGYFEFGTGSIINATDPNDSVITISASNMVLDLNGHTFGQDPASTVTGFNIIRILPNVSNIIIRNGKLTNCTGAGILIGDGCRQIRIENMPEISGCQAGGIVLDGIFTGSWVAGVFIKQCTIASCTGAQGGPAVGISINATQGCVVDDCIVQACDGLLTTSGYGAQITDSLDIEFVHCTLYGNAGYAMGAGAYVSTSTHCYFCKSYFAKNSARAVSPSTVAAGVIFNHCSQCHLEQCEILGGASGGVVYGVKTLNCSGNLVLLSVIEDQSGAYGVAGIQYENETDSHVAQNTIRNNNTTGTAYGIRLKGACSSCYLDQNNIMANEGVMSYGIIDESNPSSSAIIANRVFNHATNFSVTYTSTITLPVLNASLSNSAIGIPSGVGGILDNISITV